MQKGAVAKRGRPKKRYETVQDICDYLSVARATLYRMMDKYGLPFIYIGSYRRFDRRAVDAWLAERSKQAQVRRLAWMDDAEL